MTIPHFNERIAPLARPLLLSIVLSATSSGAPMMDARAETSGSAKGKGLSTGTGLTAQARYACDDGRRDVEG